MLDKVAYKNNETLIMEKIHLKSPVKCNFELPDNKLTKPLNYSEWNYPIEIDDIALLRADFKIETHNENNEAILIEGSSSEIVRRQIDSTWLYIVDHLFGASQVL